MCLLWDSMEHVALVECHYKCVCTVDVGKSASDMQGCKMAPSKMFPVFLLCKLAMQFSRLTMRDRVKVQTLQIRLVID